jgi:hypothetical protein
MKIGVEDWHFRSIENDVIIYDLYLGNGQHAILEVNPLRNPKAGGEMVPEIIVFCELPGEKFDDGTCHSRWLSRAPDNNCLWSHVEVPTALNRDIEDKLQGLFSEVMEGVTE